MILADRVHRFLHKLATNYLEAHAPQLNTPDYFEDLLTQFANAFPFATRSDWRRFALALAVEAHGRGFDEGVQHVEPIDMAEPDRVADVIDRQWREREPIDLINPDTIVLEEVPSDAIITNDQLRRMNGNE